MAGAAQVFSSSGALSVSPEEVLHTPSIIAILAIIFVFWILIIFAIAYYWHALEAAKKLHPNSVGYGHWYFSLIPRIWITAVSIGWCILLVVLALVVIFLFPGPKLAKAYENYKQEGVLHNLEDIAISDGQQEETVNNPQERI